MDEQYQVAYKILDENRDKMETMCKALMDWETIDRDQVLEIMAGKQPSPPKDFSHNIRQDNAEPSELQTEPKPQTVAQESAPIEAFEDSANKS